MKNTLWKVAAAAVAILVSVGIRAEAPAPYLGVSLGNTHFKIPDLDYSTDKFSWGVYAGYQFTPYIGGELAYLRANKVTESVGSGTLAIQGSAVTGSVIGTYPISDRWSIHGRVGGARTTLHATGTNGSAVATAADSSTELIYGVGIGAMLEGARIRLEYQRIDGDDVKVGSVSLGIVWFLPTRR